VTHSPLIWAPWIVTRAPKDSLRFDFPLLGDSSRIEVYVFISQQILFASNYFYDFGLSIAKLSMLAFYSSCFDPSSHSWMQRVLRDATAFVVACYLTSLLDDTSFCGKDVSVQCSQEDGSCSAFYAL
jgi:hypothetical protein